MTSIKIDFQALKRRIVGWLRDLIIVFAMWSIWLVRDYLPDIETKNIVTGFLITILTIVILIREYIVSLDNAIAEKDKKIAEDDKTILILEAKLQELKARGKQ